MAVPPTIHEHPTVAEAIVRQFQARIKPEWRHRFPHLRPRAWYDVEPLWPETRTRQLDMEGKRIARLRTGREYTSLRAEYVVFRQRPASSTSAA